MGGKGLELGRAFTILGIGADAQEDAVRDAYRQRLRQTNPEDDPEGFKQLREAYETALDGLRRGQEEQPEDDSPSGRFLGRIAALYASLSGRQDEKAWREVFRDPAFLDLEEEENCRRKLIGFLTDHHYLPTQIWRLLGERLELSGERQRLYESFPKDVIDFLARKAEQGEDFEFEQLEGEDDADLDGWIFLFSKAGREESEQDYGAMEQTVRQAEQKDIRHPGLTMMKARLLRRQGDGEAGDALVEELLEGPYAEETNVRYQAAEYFWESGRRERAAGLYEAIRQEERRHYMANKRLASWYLEQERYEETKSCVNVLLAYRLNEEGEELVEQINAGLERRLTEQLAEHPEDLKLRMDLGWCYLQSERAGEVLTLMEGVTPDADQEKDFCSLMGKARFYSQQYEAARPILQRWAELLRLQLPDDAQAQEEDLERIAAAHSMLSLIDEERARTLSGEERDAALESALAELDAAKEASYRPNQDYARAQIFFQWGKYVQCEQICEELRSRYPDLYAALSLHQQAAAKAYDVVAVISDYYQLRQIDPEFAPAWELAAEVFCQLKRWEDLDTLLREAEENGTSSARLDKYRFYRRADAAEKKSELTAALEDAARVEERWDEEDWSDTEKADFLAERARNYWRIEEYGQAIAHIDRALALSGGNKTHLYIKACVRKDQKQYEQALSLYLECRDDYDETPHFYANVGECYYRLGRGAEALPYLREAAARKKDNAAVRSWIVRILKGEMEKSGSREPLEEALKYADQMIEYWPESYFYIERGLLYVTAGNYEAAAEDFEKAAEAEPSDPYAHSNLARVRLAQGRPEDALEHALLAVKNMENAPSSYHYDMLVRVYRQLHRYEDALHTALESWKRFPEENGPDAVCDLYCMLGRWQEALEFIDRYFLKGRGDGRGDGTKPEKAGKRRARDWKIVDVYTKMGYFDQALTYIRAHYKKDGFGDEKTAERIADIYWYQGRLNRAAAELRRLTAGCPRENGDFPKLCWKAANLSFFRGKRAEAAARAKEVLAWYREHGRIEKRQGVPGFQPLDLFGLGELLLCAGETQMVYDIAAEMRRGPKCLSCDHGFCTDADELEAGIHTARKEYAAAAAIYERILAENPLDADVRAKLALVRKLEKKRKK